MRGGEGRENLHPAASQSAQPGPAEAAGLSGSAQGGCGLRQLPKGLGLRVPAASALGIPAAPNVSRQQGQERGHCPHSNLMLARIPGLRLSRKPALPCVSPLLSRYDLTRDTADSRCGFVFPMPRNSLIAAGCPTS